MYQTNTIAQSPTILFSVVIGYFLLLFFISKKTSATASQLDFYNGSKKSPWFVVAFGMVGASLSGVTFVSVPGWVYTTKFAYLQMVMGYAIGYLVIMFVLMPMYYRRNLISIYGYLSQRFGRQTQKTGSLFFILSRIIGASFRLYLMTAILHDFIFSTLGIPYWLTVFTSLILIWSYTAKAGMKTIVWTDTLQTFFIILAVIIALYTLGENLGLSLTSVLGEIKNSSYSQIFFFEGGWTDKNNFFKLFVSGVFMAIVMTGLDQDMMQKNLSCKTLKAAQKNMGWFYVILFVVNVLFLMLGALLFIYANKHGLSLPETNGKIVTDKVFPWIAFNHMPMYLSLLFLVGLLAAAYSSADSALTSLTTTYCIDIKEQVNTPKNQRIRTHVVFTAILFFCILFFRYILEESVIQSLLKVAAYTYGPLLGLFAYGILTKTKIKDKLVPYISLTAPVITFFIDFYSEQLFDGYKFGFEILLVNGCLMVLFLSMFAKTRKNSF